MRLSPIKTSYEVNYKTGTKTDAHEVLGLCSACDGTMGELE